MLQQLVYLQVLCEYSLLRDLPGLQTIATEERAFYSVNELSIRSIYSYSFIS